MPEQAQQRVKDSETLNRLFLFVAGPTDLMTQVETVIIMATAKGVRTFFKSPVNIRVSF